MAAQAVCIDHSSRAGTGEIMAASDLSRVLSAIEGLRTESREALAILRTDVNYMSKSISELGIKVDRLDDRKADLGELKAVEDRFDKSVSAVRAGAAFEAGRLTQDLTGRLESAALELNDFRRVITEEFKLIRDEVKSHEEFKNKVIGGWLVAGTAGGLIFALLNWAMHAAFPTH